MSLLYVRKRCSNSGLSVKENSIDFLGFHRVTFVCGVRSVAGAHALRQGFEQTLNPILCIKPRRASRPTVYSQCVLQA